MNTDKQTGPIDAKGDPKYDPKVAERDRIFKEALKSFLSGKPFDIDAEVKKAKESRAGNQSPTKAEQPAGKSLLPPSVPKAKPQNEKEIYLKGCLEETLKGSKYLANERVKEHVLGIEADVSLLDTLTCGRGLWKIETNDFRPMRGETVHIAMSAILRETTSSSNCNLNYRSEGKLFLTNKRFVYLGGNTLKSIEYADIERFTTDWLSNLEGNITIKQRNKARTQDFVVESAVMVGVIYWYYHSSDFRRLVDAHISCGLYDVRRHDLINHIFELQKPALEKFFRKADAEQLKNDANLGCGCFVVIAIAVVVGLVIKFLS